MTLLLISACFSGFITMLAMFVGSEKPDGSGGTKRVYLFGKIEKDGLPPIGLFGLVFAILVLNMIALGYLHAHFHGARDKYQIELVEIIGSIRIVQIVIGFIVGVLLVIWYRWVVFLDLKESMSLNQQIMLGLIGVLFLLGCIPDIIDRYLPTVESIEVGGAKIAFNTEKLSALTTNDEADKSFSLPDTLKRTNIANSGFYPLQVARTVESSARDPNWVAQEVVIRLQKGQKIEDEEKALYASRQYVDYKNSLAELVAQERFVDFLDCTSIIANGMKDKASATDIVRPVYIALSGLNQLAVRRNDGMIIEATNITDKADGAAQAKFKIDPRSRDNPEYKEAKQRLIDAASEAQLKIQKRTLYLQRPDVQKCKHWSDKDKVDLEEKLRSAIDELWDNEFSSLGPYIPILLASLAGVSEDPEVVIGIFDEWFDQQSRLIEAMDSAKDDSIGLGSTEKAVIFEWARIRARLGLVAILNVYASDKDASHSLKLYYISVLHTLQRELLDWATVAVGRRALGRRSDSVLETTAKGQVEQLATLPEARVACSMEPDQAVAAILVPTYYTVTQSYAAAAMMDDSYPAAHFSEIRASVIEIDTIDLSCLTQIKDSGYNDKKLNLRLSETYKTIVKYGILNTEHYLKLSDKDALLRSYRQLTELSGIARELYKLGYDPGPERKCLAGGSCLGAELAQSNDEIDSIDGLLRNRIRVLTPP